MRLFTGLFVALSCLPSVTYGADVNGVRNLFEEVFDSGYESGRCQYNIRAFADHAHTSGIDLRGALYLAIRGYSHVWYYHARTRLGGELGTGAWYHHYVLIVPADDSRSGKFSPDREYFVVDFDYGNEPRLVDLRTYLSTMFMSKAVRENESLMDQRIEYGLLKVTAHDVSKLAGELRADGEFPSAAEKSALVFDESPFIDFYRELGSHR